jgi:hypothetical protein
MRSPRFRIRTLMLAVAIAGVAFALVSRRQHRYPCVVCICVEPPVWSRWAYPYDPDTPPLVPDENNWGLPPVCETHIVGMRPESVPISYLLSFINPDRKYSDARSAAFPHCDNPIQWGRIFQPEEFISMYICQDCNAARDAWIAETAEPHETVDASAY